MQRCSLFMVLAAGAMLSVGCGMQPGSQPTAAKGGLAVIDLDLLAKTIGRNQEINEAWQVRKNALDQGLQKLQASFRDQIQTKKTEAGDEATDEQKKTIAAMEREANNKLVQATRTAQNDLEKFRQQMVAQFRAEVRPVAQQVASTKGLSVVIPKNEGFLLSVDPGVDITADVIAAYQAKKPAAAAPAAKSAPMTAPEMPAETASAPEAAERR